MAVKTKKQKNPVLVTTSHRGAFQGDLINYNQETKQAIIAQARCCIAWRNIKGFLALTSSGPGSDCRITPATPELTLEGVVSIAKCTPEAVSAWEKEPWG